MTQLQYLHNYECPNGCGSFNSDEKLDEFSRDCNKCGSVCVSIGYGLSEPRPREKLSHTKKVIYVAGPYRGSVDINVKNAELYAARLAELGISFICPHSNGHPHDDLGLSDDYWINMTLELMRRCDAVLVLPNWATSEGTKGEIREAYDIGKPVFFSIEILKLWLVGR